MEPYSISTKSLAFRLAVTYGGLNLRKAELNICTLRSYMLLGVLKITVYGLAIVFMAYVLGIVDVFAWLAAMATTMQYITPSQQVKDLGIAAIAVPAMSIALGIFGVVLFTILKFLFKPKNNAVALAFKSWREKACYKLVIKD